MKKQFISLSMALLVLITCMVIPFSAGAETGLGTPYQTYMQNFDDIATTAAKDEIAEQSGLTLSSGSGTFSVIADGGTNKLQLSSPVNTGDDVVYELSTPVTSGTIETSVKIGTNGLGMGAHHLLQHGNGTAYRSLLEAMSAWHYYPNNTRTEVSTGTPSLNSETGMYHLRSVVSRADANDDWLATLYDDSGDTPVALYSTTISAETYPQLTAVQLLSTYGYNGSNAAQVVTIDDLTVNLYSGVPAAAENFSQNFNSLTKATYTAAEFTDFAAETGLTVVPSASGNDDIVVTDGAVKLTATGAYPNTKTISLDYRLTAPVLKGVLEVSLKTGIENMATYGGARHFLFFNNGVTGGSSTVQAMQAWGKGDLGVALSVVPTVSSETGMYHLRAVIYREGTGDDWKVILYDDVPAAPVAVLSGTVSKDSLDLVDRVRMAYLYPDANISATMDDIAVTYYQHAEDAFPSPVLTEDNYLINEDYTGAGYTAILDTPQNAATMQGLNSALTYASADSTSFTVKEKGSTRYLSVQGSSGSVGHSVSASFADIAAGNVVMEEKILLAEQAQAGIDYKIGILNGAMTLGSTEGYLIESMNNGNNIFGYPTGTLNTKKYAFTKDGDGFVHIKWVLSRKTAAENWILHIYDGLTEELMDSVSVPYIDPGDNSGKFIDAFRQATFVNSWGLNSTTVTLNATGFKVWQPKSVSFTQTAHNTVTKTVSFTPSEALKASTVSASTVALRDADGNAVTVTDAGYANGVLSVTTDALLPAGEYTLCCNGVQTARSTYVYDVSGFEIETPTGLVFSNLTASAGASSLSVSVDVLNTELASVPFELVLAVYDGADGPLVKAASLRGQTTTDDGTSKTVTVTVDGVTPSEALSGKLFFLQSLTGLQPLRAAEVLSPAQFQ